MFAVGAYCGNAPGWKLMDKHKDNASAVLSWFNLNYTGRQRASPEFQLQENTTFCFVLDNVAGTIQPSKQLARLSTVLAYCEEKKIQIPDSFPRLNTSPPPLEVLNQLQQPTCPTFEQDETDLVGTYLFKTATGDDSILQARYPLRKDARYVKNKLCLELLRQAAQLDERALQAYQTVSKEPLFYRLRRLTWESDQQEFKGGPDLEKAMKMATLVGKSDDIGKTMCAFLNSKGGTLIAGVHDGTRSVQGVLSSDPDGDLLRLQSKLLEKLNPKPASSLFSVRFYPVLEVLEEEEEEQVIPKSEEGLIWFNKYKDLKERIGQGTKYQNGSQLVVFVFEARPSNQLTIYGGHCYVRQTGQNQEVTFEQLKDMIIAEHASGSFRKAKSLEAYQE